MEGNRPRNVTTGVNNFVSRAERDINGTWTEEGKFPRAVSGAWASLGVPPKKRSEVYKMLSASIYINCSANEVLLPRDMGTKSGVLNQQVRQLLINLSTKKLS